MELKHFKQLMKGRKITKAHSPEASWMDDGLHCIDVVLEFEVDSNPLIRQLLTFDPEVGPKPGDVIKLVKNEYHYDEGPYDVENEAIDMVQYDFDWLVNSLSDDGDFGGLYLHVRYDDGSFDTIDLDEYELDEEIVEALNKMPEVEAFLVE